jgi:hypothetical protein
MNKERKLIIPEKIPDDTPDKATGTLPNVKP